MKRLSFLFLLVLTGCQQSDTDIFVSLVPLQGIVQEISDNMTVDVMVPVGANPHTYEPTPSKIKEVSEARMYVKAGSGIEFEVAWFDKIRSLNKDMIVVDASDGLDFENPHIWLSLSNLEVIANNIYQGLAELDPENKETYKANLDEYLSRIRSIDQEITVRNKSFVAFHPAWDYFARDYNLTQVPIMKEGKEPTFQDVREVIEKVNEENISVILVSPQFSSRYADAISEETNAKVVRADTLASDTPSTIREIAQVIG
ncbi:MAG: metal ABC transporter solute-binding protein, Zn/Mn family [Candidatus Woesearchaeota archaeon]